MKLFSNICEINSSNLLRKFFLLLVVLLIFGRVFSQNNLPKVFPYERSNDIIASVLNLKAEKAYEVLQVPGNIDDWLIQKEELRRKIIDKANVSFFPDLPLDYRETGSIKQHGYTIKNIYFQTRPNIYATANLYIPDGEGPFPGVVTMMGHSTSGKLKEVYQSIGITLALNGYVSINIDPWGAGERTTEHGKFEYHGANLGASLMNVGETLLGLQITDNMRAVDLLISLPFVDSGKIGATGASGGGNQTMWLAAMDERVKAAVPVVSVGTFQSYVMNSNCICETLLDGLTFTEESSVLGLIAPRALKICNGKHDSNQAFYPEEMLKSYQGAKSIYKFYEFENNLSYEIFDTRHGYFPVIRESMLGWFNYHLKNIGNGDSKSEKSFTALPESDLMVFKKGERPLEVISTAEFCYNQGLSLKENVLSQQHIEANDKIEELKNILKVPNSNLYKSYRLTDSGDWERHILETTSGMLIPALIYVPNKSRNDFVLISSFEGKNNISSEFIQNIIDQNKGLCIIDLLGIGENSSHNAKHSDGNHLPEFHTLSRSAMWLGTTIQGIWINQLSIVSDWLMKSQEVQNLTFYGDRDVAVAGLLSSVTERKFDKLVLRNAPLSYLFDKHGEIDQLSMAVHIPNFLKWGDVLLAAALSNIDITFENPVTISGRQLKDKEIENVHHEFSYLKSLINSQQKLNILTN